MCERGLIFTNLQVSSMQLYEKGTHLSYNEEQEIVSIILPTSSFLSARLMKKNCIESASLIFFDFSIYIGLVILNYNQFMGILLSLFFTLVWSFSICL